MITLDMVLFNRTSNDENDGQINAFSNMIFYDINVIARLLAEEMGKQKMFVKSSKCQCSFEVIVVLFCFFFNLVMHKEEKDY